MPEETENQNLNFQPETKGYMYVNNSFQEKKPNIFFRITLGITVLLFSLLLLICILNYFSIISLSFINPSLFSQFYNSSNSIKQNVVNNHLTAKNNAQNSGVIIFLPQSKSWKADGTLYSYNDNIIQIKVGNQIIKLTFSYENSMFYKQTSVVGGGTTSSAVVQNIPYTLYDLDQQVNLNKNVEVYYTKDNFRNDIIQTITLLN